MTSCVGAPSSFASSASTARRRVSLPPLPQTSVRPVTCSRTAVPRVWHSRFCCSAGGLAPAAPRLASRLLRGCGGDGACTDDTDLPGWRVNGRDVVDDDSPAPTDGDDDLRNRWRLARWLLVRPLALAAIVLSDEHAPVAGRQTHKKTCFQAGTLGKPTYCSRRLGQPVRRASL
jgi:hypothetical protein